ncbi:hypothetical protein Tco_0948588 [Tanacetum coccineum]
MFIKYSTSLLPPKKSRGKGSQGKKTADTSEADVDVFEESNSEPARKRTASRRVIKKKVLISADDNIIPEPDVALELGKSLSLTEAAEEEAARQLSLFSESDDTFPRLEALLEFCTIFVVSTGLSWSRELVISNFAQPTGIFNQWDDIACQTLADIFNDDCLHVRPPIEFFRSGDILSEPGTYFNALSILIYDGNFGEGSDNALTQSGLLFFRLKASATTFAFPGW